MPPPLSDYESDSDFGDYEPTGINESRRLTPAIRQSDSEDNLKSSSPVTKRQSLKRKAAFSKSVIERAAFKGKKRSALLHGIDLDNIIPVSRDEHNEPIPKDTLPTSSVSTSYKTRAQIHGTPKSELYYNQKYHPMDEFTQPKRAASLRSKYVERSVVSDNESIASDRDEDNYFESESENGELKVEVKRTKLSVPLSTHTTRRSSRQLNRDVLYDVNIHPQDDEIKMLEFSQEHEEHHSEGTNTESQAESDNDNEYKTDSQRDEHGDAENIMDRTIPETEDSASEDSLSTYDEPSPMPSVGRERSLANDTRLKDERLPLPGRYYLGSGLPFTIYTEDIQAQIHAEALAPPPVEYIDDDKENDMKDPNLEPTPDPLDAIRVQSALEYRQNANNEEDVEYHTSFDRLMDVIDLASSRYHIPDIDGAMDDDETIELKFEPNSVFGKSSPEDSVVGGSHGRHPNPSRS
ncbi:hypothetical protein K505DRAFT_370525 [Melanomma pulvis-pyrius CBS 109.77]|uniref:Uncharacterized protein n=1 Tax=Melanomma pulvis-pyrius CBS 109.77 TaxID=1314802 RepID=A0A6A6XUP0_9PLEO|nr:hypothetical protein K505DRAFT_370525 [Melanomma pulvis-pyrius CBS 109.77]